MPLCFVPCTEAGSVWRSRSATMTHTGAQLDCQAADRREKRNLNGNREQAAFKPGLRVTLDINNRESKWKTTHGSERACSSTSALFSMAAGVRETGHPSAADFPPSLVCPSQLRLLICFLCWAFLAGDMLLPFKRIIPSLPYSSEHTTLFLQVHFCTEVAKPQQFQPEAEIFRGGEKTSKGEG